MTLGVLHWVGCICVIGCSYDFKCVALDVLGVAMTLGVWHWMYWV